MPGLREVFPEAADAEPDDLRTLLPGESRFILRAESAIYRRIRIQLQSRSVVIAARRRGLCHVLTWPISVLGAYDPSMTGPVDDAGDINYDLALPLDAEDLAEQGILDAYREITPLLARHGVQAGPVTENLECSSGNYSVDFDGQRYVIWGPGGAGRPWESQGDSWGLATYALFDIVNRQLAGTDVRFFALNGGNDLFGIFMSTAQAEKARRALPRKRNWPYLPVPEPPGFGAPWE